MTRCPPAIAQGAYSLQTREAWERARLAFFQPRAAKDYLAQVFGDSK